MTAIATMESIQYLTFKLEDEIFALDIGKVREVLEYSTITKMPKMPEFMSGVINIRGNAVPVVDLRFKFGEAVRSATVWKTVTIK
jgi:purine-binding chemotaxis protein CheW